MLPVSAVSCSVRAGSLWCCSQLCFILLVPPPGGTPKAQRQLTLAFSSGSKHAQRRQLPHLQVSARYFAAEERVEPRVNEFSVVCKATMGRVTEVRVWALANRLHTSATIQACWRQAATTQRRPAPNLGSWLLW